MSHWGFWHLLIIAHLGVATVIFLFLFIVLTIHYVRWTYGLRTKFRLKIRAWDSVNDALEAYYIRYPSAQEKYDESRDTKWTQYKGHIVMMALLALFGGVHWFIIFYCALCIAKIAGWLLAKASVWGKDILRKICLSREERVSIALGVEKEDPR